MKVNKGDDIFVTGFNTTSMVVYLSFSNREVVKNMALTLHGDGRMLSYGEPIGNR